jgi:hypothetical protein
MFQLRSFNSLFYGGTPICLDCESKREKADTDQRSRTERVADGPRLLEENHSRAGS